MAVNHFRSRPEDVNEGEQRSQSGCLSYRIQLNNLCQRIQREFRDHRNGDDEVYRDRAARMVANWGEWDDDGDGVAGGGGGDADDVETT